MRDRHIPRLCRSCHGPMARQEESCWGCGTRWTPDQGPRPRLKVAEAPADGERWVDEGGNRAAVAAQ